ncbi:MAG: hypothetical protein ACLGHN_01125 [Bacteriovoracia bacterium]
MKVQKAVSILATLSVLSFAVACNSGDSSDRYSEGFAAGKQQGYEEGYDTGYDDGYADGDAAGYARAEAYFASQDYNSGYADGRASGLSEGYNTGYTDGKNDGLAEGYTTGYNAGYDDGDADGYTRGYNVGYDDGYADGGTDSYSTGYNAGYTDGYDDGAIDGYDTGYTAGTAYGYDLGYDVGWDDGYNAGFNDGYALSVGPTPKLSGYADVLSAFHNDLIDYSKIDAPKQTKRGLVVNGKLLLSEVSMTNKDTLKRAAVVEQYLVIEMAKQVKGKFGLSAERSLKVAKAANHFRKFATKRALTAEDTNAYATELVGANFKTIEKAYENTMKGDTTELQNVLDKAAEKNGVSPEKMGEIMAKMFL